MQSLWKDRSVSSAALFAQWQAQGNESCERLCLLETNERGTVQDLSLLGTKLIRLANEKIALVLNRSRTAV